MHTINLKTDLSHYRYRLKFENSQLEDDFQKDFFSKSIGIFRVSILLAVFMFASFGLLDPYAAPSTVEQLYILRYAFIVPFFILIFIISFLKFFEAFMQKIGVLVPLAGGWSILVMIYLANDRIAFEHYYIGLILVTIWSYTLAKLQFFFSLWTSISFLAGYNVIAIYKHNMLATDELFAVFINNNAFLVSGIIISAFAGFLVESYIRTDFIHRRMIDSERSRLAQSEEKNQVELKMAKRIQQQIIPSADDFPNLHALYKPVDYVGGDFYDLITFSQEELVGIFICDVTGHGVSSSLVTAMIKTILLQSDYLKGDPARLLDHLNTILFGQTGEKFITAFYGIFNSKTKSITYSNAGHYSPFLINSDEITILPDIKTIPLTMSPTEKYPHENVTVNLPANSKILFYTDGLLDVRNNKGIYFDNNLINVLHAYKQHNSKEFIESLYLELVQFKGEDKKFLDDICMVCIDV